MIDPKTFAMVEPQLLAAARNLYRLDGYTLTALDAHEGGWNRMYRCDREGAEPRMLRVALRQDRGHEAWLAEMDFIRYLHDGGADVADVIASRNGNLTEPVRCEAGICDAEPARCNAVECHLALFERAAGMQLAENGYRYREGVPLSVYFHDCGKTLGRIHRLSQAYRPTHKRWDFFDQFNARTIERTVPASLTRLRESLLALLDELAALPRDASVYGLLHFDFNDGNFHIDYDTGRLTVFDFDNACTGWFLFDLASLWLGGMGWIQFEHDADKRRAFMDSYWQAVLEGYRSEMAVDGQLLAQLPLFIQANLMEGVVDAFDRMRQNGEEPVCDDELAYRIRCLEDNVPYSGFFDDMYDADAPFTAEERVLQACVAGGAMGDTSGSIGVSCGSGEDMVQLALHCVPREVCAILRQMPPLLPKKKRLDAFLHQLDEGVRSMGETRTEDQGHGA